MSLFRTLKRLMSTFRISYFPHCNLRVLMLAESGSLKATKSRAVMSWAVSRNLVECEP